MKGKGTLIDNCEELGWLTDDRLSSGEHGGKEIEGHLMRTDNEMSIPEVTIRWLGSERPRGNIMLMWRSPESLGWSSSPQLVLMGNHWKIMSNWSRISRSLCSSLCHIKKWSQGFKLDVPFHFWPLPLVRHVPNYFTFISLHLICILTTLGLLKVHERLYIKVCENYCYFIIILT